MAPGEGGSVPSDPMDLPLHDRAIPGSARPAPADRGPTPSPSAPPAPRRADDADAEGPSRESLSIKARLRQPRTILSIAVPLVIIAVFVYLNREDLERVPSLILQANPLLILLAFGIFYLGFPLRGYRWASLLRGSGVRIRVKDATEILFLSWLVNCVVPAKLGDVYRAYLLKINSTTSLSRTFGTVFTERILDLFAIATLGLAAGFWSFRSGMPGPIQAVFVVGLVVILGLGLGMFTLRNFGRRLIVALPLPGQVLELYDRFEEGVFGAIGVRQLPRFGILTGLIWATESLRLFFVVQAFGFSDVTLGISGAVFVALIGSLLTAVPLAPAGLGVVELGVAWVLTNAYGVPVAEATAIVLLDRVISVFSIIVLGSIAYALSAKPRGEERVADESLPSGAV